MYFFSSISFVSRTPYIVVTVLQTDGAALQVPWRHDMDMNIKLVHMWRTRALTALAQTAESLMLYLSSICGPMSGQTSHVFLSIKTCYRIDV